MRVCHTITEQERSPVEPDCTWEKERNHLVFHRPRNNERKHIHGPVTTKRKFIHSIHKHWCLCTISLLHISKQKVMTTVCFADEQKRKYFHSKVYKFSSVAKLRVNNVFIRVERDVYSRPLASKKQQGLSARKHVNNLPILKSPLFTLRKISKVCTLHCTRQSLQKQHHMNLLQHDRIVYKTWYEYGI